MASGLFLTDMNYFLVGWFNGYLDKYYTESWKSWFYSYDVSILVLTNCSPPLDLCRLHLLWKSHSCNYSLSSFRKKFCGGTTRKFQMGAHDAHFLRWPFLSPFALPSSLICSASTCNGVLQQRRNPIRTSFGKFLR